MTQESQPPQDIPILEKPGASGSVADGLDSIMKEVNAIRSANPVNEANTADNARTAQAAAGELPSLQIGDQAARSAKVGDALGELKVLDFADKFKTKEIPLSRTENLILNGLTAAIGKQDIAGMQEMLSTIAENPGSMDRILNAAREQMAKTNPNVHVGWESGTDDQGNNFVRLKMDMTGSKSGPFTHLTVGSDGTTNGSHTPFMQYDRPAQALTGEQALRMLMAPPKFDRYERLRPDPVKPIYENFIDRPANPSNKIEKQ